MAVANRFVLIVFASCLWFICAEIGYRLFLYTKEAETAGVENEDALRNLLTKSQTSLVPVRTTSSLRDFIQISPSRDVIYELKPYLLGFFQGKRLQTNSLGMRDRHYNIAKPQRTVRIVGLGDSVMFGWGVEEKDSYLNIVEQRLNSWAEEKCNNRNFEILNFAVPGYNTAMEVATFEYKALAFQPDIVVVHFVNNDFGVPLFMQRPKNLFSLADSFFIDFVQERVSQLFTGEEQIEDDLVSGTSSQFAGKKTQAVIKQYQHMLGHNGFRRAMARLGKISRERNMHVVILVGRLATKTERLMREVMKKWGFSVIPIKPYVDAFIKKNNIPNTPSARRETLWVSAQDHHPNATGHLMYAEGLFEHLQGVIDEAGMCGKMAATQ